MITQNKNYVSMEQIYKIKQANESVKGTLEYNKYAMQSEYKHKNKYEKNFSSWIFIRYDIPIKNMKYYIKKIKSNLYIISEEYNDGADNLIVDRWLVNDEVKKLLNID